MDGKTVEPAVVQFSDSLLSIFLILELWKGGKKGESVILGTTLSGRYTEVDCL